MSRLPAGWPGSPWDAYRQARNRLALQAILPHESVFAWRPGYSFAGHFTRGQPPSLSGRKA
jgi:hypothetical protein